MKTYISLTALIIGCYVHHSCGAQEVAKEQLMVVTPNGGQHFNDSPLEIVWRHPSVHARKTVFVSITLLPAENAGTAKGGHYALVESGKVVVPDGNFLTGKISWKIPEGFPVGLYRVSIVAVPENDFSGLAWDTSESSFAVTVRPKIRFLLPTTPDITVGDTQRFIFSLQGPDIYTIEAFLLKDDRVEGLVWWRRDEAADDMMLVWLLTRYENESGFHFPRAGDGYRILIGILKDSTQTSYTPEVGVELAAFANYAMTEPFRVTGSLPRVLTERADAPGQFYITVLGEPRSNFILARSPVVPAVIAIELLRDTVPSSGIWERLLTRHDDVDLFVFPLPTGALER